MLRGRNLFDRDYDDWSAGGGLMRRLADRRSFELSARTRW
jgi:outer membrane receptor protein involved in Fe transport